VSAKRADKTVKIWVKTQPVIAILPSCGIKKDTMLKIKNISKKYSKTIALNKVDLEVPKNSITGIIGPNGAGKSTLMKIISGFEDADEGKIYLNNKPLVSFNEKKLNFYYMPECLELYPDYSVGYFIEFIHKTTKYIDMDLIETLGLTEVKNKKIAHLSKGYRQRLKLFPALSNSKNIVILDEPFDGFDPIQIMKMLKLIKAEREKGRTFILSIHQLYDAEKICDYYVLLNKGNIITQGTMNKLRQEFGEEHLTLEQIFIKAMQ